ncbi:MAG: molybdopterin molybdenumtransferase MoeA [Rhodobacteraceae bacterium]|nr:molybdopterin molybdenumtransferase MoeA [Paracoccaceae bacterium]
MLSVEAALHRIFDLVSPLNGEAVPLRHAAGRVLAQPVVASADQPPFAASIMDGYAICGRASPGDQFDVIGESAAGQRFEGGISPGQAVRIFTGAPVPTGAESVVIQEDTRRSGDRIIIGDSPESATYIRPAGADFRKGEAINPPLVITPSHVALFAAMNAPHIIATRRPDVAIIATGDELVQPGETPQPDQIIASNALGLAAMLDGAGAIARLLPIARDTPDALHTAFELARGADMVVTIGGASVGERDLVAPVAQDRGADMALHKIAMRPGKPLMAGRLDGAVMIGLPGNPVSSMVCGNIFILPAIRKMLGLPAQALARRHATLASDLPKNGPREHYMRARSDQGRVTPFECQDSALLSVLATADCLIVQPPGASPAQAGDLVEVVDL